MMPKTKEPSLQEVACKTAFDEAVENCEYFIDQFGYIEDPDAENTAIKINLWPMQRVALREMLRNRLTVVPKARQLGITWLEMLIDSWMLLRPGKRVFALSRREEDANELVRRVEFILRHLPGWMMVQSNAPLPDRISYDWKATEVTVYHPGNEPSVFKSFPAGANSGRSFTGNRVVLDEWAFQDYAREIWTAAFPTVNRPTGGQVCGISTMALGTVFEEVVRGALAKTNDFKMVFLPWYADPRRTKEWYDKTKRAIGADAMKREYPATVQEALESAGGRFFYELREDAHIKPKENNIPKDYKRYLSIDYGTDMLAAIWYYIDYEGYARVYRERHQSGLSVTEACELIKEANGGDRLRQIFAPDDLWLNQSTSSKSIAIMFAENGMPLTKTARSREHGWVAVREWLRVHEKKRYDGSVILTAKLTIDEGAAPELWRCLNTILSDKNNPRDAAKDPHDVTHLPDSIRAFCMHWQHPSKDTTPVLIGNSLEDLERRRIERIGKEQRNGKKAVFV